MRRTMPALFGMTLVLLATEAWGVMVSYRTLGWIGEPQAVNSLGQIAGGMNNLPVIWNPDGTHVTLASGGYLFEINDSGNAVGHYVAADGRHVIRFSADGTCTDLGLGYAYGTSASDSIAGMYYRHAARWDATGAVTTLAKLANETSSCARDISDLGHMVGFTNDSNSIPTYWDTSGAVRALPRLPGCYEGHAVAVNNQGYAVGYCSSTFSRAVLWSPSGQVTDLGALPGYLYSSAFDINNAGQIVGFCTNQLASPSGRAFFWSAETGMLDLGAYCGSTAETWAYSINDVGQVVGHGPYGAAAMWTVVPEPPSCSILAFAVTALSTALRFRAFRKRNGIC